MAGDILRILSKLQRSVFTNVDITINLVEISPTLSQIQFDHLCVREVTTTSGAYKSGITRSGFKVNWFCTLDEVPRDPIFTVVLAHEFFDALPVHKFKKTPAGYREVYVDIDPTAVTNDFRFVLLPHANMASKTVISSVSYLVT